MIDRFQAQPMFGGFHVRFNPGGRLWEVYDMDKCDVDYDGEVIDRIDEETAKDLAARLSAANKASRTNKPTQE